MRQIRAGKEVTTGVEGTVRNQKMTLGYVILVDANGAGGYELVEDLGRRFFNTEDEAVQAAIRRSVMYDKVDYFISPAVIKPTFGKVVQL